MAADYSGSYSSLSALGVSSLTIPYPLTLGGANPQNGNLMVCLVRYAPTSGSATASMSGWISEANVSDAYCFSKQGDGSGGNGVIVFTGDTVNVTAAIILLDGTATSSAKDVSNTASTAGSVHSVSSVTTTVANDILLGFWSGSTNLTGYTYAMNGQILQFTTQNKGFDPVPGVPMTISYDTLGAAGATGAKQCTSFQPLTGVPINVSTLGILIAFKPFNGPSVPTITAPVTSENVTIGRIYDVTWNPSTDPTVAQSALTYNLDYSDNDGTSWNQIVANTSAGAVTYAWNTAGRTPGSQYKLRLRAHNGTDYSVTYYTTGRFTLSADATPLAPSNMRGEQPDGTSVSLFDIGVALVVKGTFNDPGDVMTAFQLDWGTDGSTYPNTSTNTTSTLAKTYAASTFSAGTIYFRCRTADYAATYGPYATFSLTAAAAPSAPNITAPTSASPPTAPTPTITWTSVGQVKYRIRITQAGVEKYNGGYVSSGSQSVTSPYSFANTTTYTLYLSIEDANGLRSTEDSETFTASYVGPSTPTLTATAVNEQGYVELLIANPDTPSYNEIWRYLSTQTTDDAIRLATSLPVDGTFQDYSPTSGVGYKYFVRAYAAGGGFTNSVASSTITLTLSNLFIHVVSRVEGATANAVTGQIVSLGNIAPAEIDRQIQHDRKKARGRTKPVAIMGQTELRSARCQVILTDAEISAGKERTLEAILNANAVVCYRDQRRNRLFGKFTNLPLAHSHTFSGTPIEVREIDYTEAV